MIAEQIQGCTENSYGHLDVEYRGDINRDTRGRECQKWTSQIPHSHGYTPDSYPNDGLGDHNFCRDPSGSVPGARVGNKLPYTLAVPVGK